MKYSILKKIVSLKEKKKELEKQLKELESQVKEELLLTEDYEEDGKVVFLKKDIKVQLTTAKREGVDTKKLKKDLPDIFEKYKKVSEYPVLKIEKIKTEE